ncbi:Na+/H+ antiporter subunit A [Corynebacterium pilosum]|uniref:Putative monovalent cation/H+ antiporter subunit A n=1 Tax=Corynebacterium pilosum TaxID=35756 RepID=A0A376CL10_9CORY|nr:Na+/H+ antiporter subunit A [Corynebacterium pilosum]STC68877.1 putative monovalent cation/H+ antiporter subunit A [Corynebacterium pilosum]
MLTLLVALAIATIAAPFLIRSMGRIAFCLLALVPAAGFVWIVSLFTTGAFAQGVEIRAAYEWMPSAHLNLEFRLDPLAGLFSLIILGVGALVLLYCWGYFDSNPRRLSMFGAQMVCFAAAMYGLVISDNFLLMYIFWEITSVLSFLLVGYYGERASSRRAAGQALMVTTLGGLSMLVGIILFGRQTGVWRLSEIATFDAVGETPYATAAVILILAGALSKSAIAPTHFWLPGAMAAPTPVSAYLHSAAMVKAGIYLVARLAPDFNAIGTWHLVVIPLGVFTMLLGGWMALRQKDLKLILAYGTVSQLGFIMSIIGIGSEEALQAGLVLTFSHSLFKAALFMIVGAIDHTTGTRDIRELSGLGRKQPLIATLAVISAASMAGIPPLLGFIAKEAALTNALTEPLLTGMPGQLLLVGVVVGSILTMAYSLYFLWGAFSTKELADGTDNAVETMHNIGPSLWFSPAVLTALTVFLGLFPGWLDRAITSHLNARYPETQPEPLALWHGFNIPLLLTVVIIVLGSLLFWKRKLLQYFYDEKPALGSADTVYDNTLRGLSQISLRLTASTQRGSLTINLGVIFAVLILVPLVSLILGERTDIRMVLWDSPWQAIASVIIIVMAFAATQMENRLSGIIAVGMTGYSLAFIFALHGAPDLALTQTLVETIVMVVFMLVLRKMPTQIEPRQNQDNRLRAWLSVAVGLSVTIVAVFAISARTERPISDLMPDLAYDIGHGANTVNVLLVDLRAWDTFGEISVLVIAATGVASLIYRTRSFVRPSRRPTLSTTSRRWLAADVDSEKAQNRSLMVDVVTRVLFPSMMALSLYFFFAGHNAPGGGFAGGLVAALAITLRYLAGGRDELEETLPIDPAKILGTGLILSAAAAVIPMFRGQPPLTSDFAEVTLPLIGEIAIPSALLFDAGVYIIVVGLIMHILTSMGGHLDQEEEVRKQRARDRARSLKRKAEFRRRQQEQRKKRIAAQHNAPGSSSSASETSGSTVATLEKGQETDHSKNREEESEDK